jgi:hypothetical protein
MKSYTRTVLPSLLCVALFGQTLQAQEPVKSVVLIAESQPSMDSTQVDSLPPAPKPRLLPTSMSFLERALWDEDGFLRNVGIISPLTPETRKNELALRRTMLSIHQIGGFVTLGLMGAAVWYGQHALDHPAVKTYRSMHQTFVTATIISYSATGLMAVLAPPPLIRRDEVSTTTIHKTLAWVHFAGMVLTPILGASLHRGRVIDYGQLARFHQISAYVTTATFAAAMIVITF